MFPRRQRTTFLRLFFPPAILMLVGLLFYGRADVEREQIRLRSQESLHLGLGAGALSRALDSVTRDLDHLASQRISRSAIDAPTAGNLRNLAEDLAAFSRSKGIYDQLRWIDESGMEVLRVDMEGGRPVVVAADRLQNKRDRYYFTETSKLDPGEMFISPMDLNIENGQIEIPYKPMVRLATPVADRKGRRRGIIILNLQGQALLGAFAKAGAAIADHAMLANGDGYWLKSPRPEEEWGFMFKRGDLSLPARYPRAWDRIRAAPSGQDILADGLWTWQHVYPLPAKPAFGHQGSANSYVWVAVSHLPREAWMAGQRAERQKLALVAALLLALLGLGSWTLARAWTGLSSAEEHVRQLNADLERRVEERTGALRQKVAELDAEISDRRRAETAMRESEAHYRTLFERVPDGILIADKEGRYLDANESMCRMLGYTHDEIVGMTALDIVVPAEIPNIEPALGAIQRHADYHREWDFRRKDGTVLTAEVSAILMPDGNLLAMFRDITERRQAEEERQRLQYRLQQTQKMESLGSLAGGVAHDMNNVLAAILGLASAHLETQPEGSPVHRAFNTISKAATRGGMMVKSLLNFARQTPMENLDLDFNAIIREEVHLLERTTLAKVRLEMDLAADLRLIRGDAGALTHAIMNLCVNAVDAMPEDGRLLLRTRNKGEDRVEVFVEDTGTGMPREVLERALDPFFTTKEHGKGTGLGLSMVYSTVKAHQGQLEIRSQPGMGTCVRMSFPASETRSLPSGPPAEPQLEAASRAQTVLVIDDDGLVQCSMRTVLESLGYRVSMAADGEEALAQLQAGLRPDVAILDMNMPGMGGGKTLPRLRALLPALPILLSTGRVDQAVLDLVESHERVALLPKPFSNKEMQKQLETILKA